MSVTWPWRAWTLDSRQPSISLPKHHTPSRCDWQGVTTTHTGFNSSGVRWRNLFSLPVILLSGGLLAIMLHKFNFNTRVAHSCSHWDWPTRQCLRWQAVEYLRTGSNSQCVVSIAFNVNDCNLSDLCRRYSRLSFHQQSMCLYASLPAWPSRKQSRGPCFLSTVTGR